MKSGRIWLFLFLGLVVLSWAVYKLRYRMSYASDLENRPWAYSEDPAARLLVGKWQGSFTDPGGVEKQVLVEILVPVTEEEREKKANRRARDRGGIKSRGSKQAFGGTATVTSRLGQEDYELSGSVEKEDHHRLRFQFYPEDEQKRILPNFTLREANPGTWRDDDMTLTLNFTKNNADGSSTSSSEGVVVDGKLVWQESPEEKPVTVTLKRKAP